MMTDEQIEKAKDWCEHFNCYENNGFRKEHCPLDGEDFCKLIFELYDRLKAERQLRETQLKELLSALYRQTGEEKRGDFTAHKGITLYRSDIVELAKDYDIKEEELK